MEVPDFGRRQEWMGKDCEHSPALESFSVTTDSLQASHFLSGTVFPGFISFHQGPRALLFVHLPVCHHLKP